MWKATKIIERLFSKHLISIHAFRVEGDIMLKSLSHREHNFNPRLPCGRRHSQVLTLLVFRDFNPRLPCGRRPLIAETLDIAASFQSTPSVWKATRSNWLDLMLREISIHAFRVEGDTRYWCAYTGYAYISIHAFRVEGDIMPLINLSAICNFNPRLPCGRRL